MSSNMLLASERSAIGGKPFKASVKGKKSAKKGQKKSLGALASIIIVVFLAGFFFVPAYMIPSMIMERLIEEFDVQWADAVESKIIVFKEALKNGAIPKVTASFLKNYNVLVGYIKNGGFIEGYENKDGGNLVLKSGEEIVTPEKFVEKVHSDVGLYNAFNQATYSRAAYYYDDSAYEALKDISSRNNFTSDSDFNEVMDSLMGSGSDIAVNSVSVVEEETEDGVEIKYVENGEAGSSKNDAWEFINAATAKSTGADRNSATLNSASVLNIADTISKETRSQSFYLGNMENFSKMKAGDGGDSQIMESLSNSFETKTNEVFDIKSGKVVKVEGSALESPSLYAVLTKKDVNTEDVANYSSDRILKTVESKLEGASGYGAITSNTVSTSTNSVKGKIGRLADGDAIGDQEIIGAVAPVIQGSLIENSYKTISGIPAGEFLVEGAINVGNKLAKMSGGTVGDEEAVLTYMNLNNEIIALDAKADRLNRSPFDITSKNTFLGSIVYNFGISMGHTWSSGFSKSMAFTNVASKSIASIFPTTRADNVSGYLSKFGDCESLSTIGAVGTPQCAETIVFDTSTLNDPYNNPEFLDYVERNTTVDSSGNYTIKKDSHLAGFIEYSVKRNTPNGLIDAGILSARENKSSSIPFVSDFASMVRSLLDASEQDKRVASGAAFVNSKYNADWVENRNAQRFVSIARAIALMKKTADDDPAYSRIKFFSGSNNPVMAFIDELDKVAEK